MEIRLHNVTAGYGRQAVASGLDACLQQGELVCLLGANGAGKSTLLRTIGGVQPALGGQVLVDGEPIGVAGTGRMSRLVGALPTRGSGAICEPVTATSWTRPWGWWASRNWPVARCSR